MSVTNHISACLPSYANGPALGTLEHARMVLESCEQKLADTLEAYYNLDRRYEWLLANKDAHPDPQEREKMNQSSRSICLELATYKRDWGPQARMGVRFWEDEVKRLEQAARTAEAGKGAGK